LSPDGRDSLGPIKNFIAEKSPRSDVERILCLGFCLAELCGLHEFSYSDLRRLNDDLGLRRLSNPWLAARKARARGLVAYAGGQKMSLTADGKAVVDLLSS